MPVYKPKGSPYFHYSFQLNGVRFRKSTKATTRRAAEKVEERDRAAILEGDADKPRMSVDTAFERYYQEKAKHQVSADDTDRQLDTLRAFFGGDTDLGRITDSDVAAFVAKRRGEKVRIGKKRRPGKRLVSNATVNREIELLRRVMMRAHKTWKVALTMPDWSQHLLPEPKERVRELSPQEQTALLKHLRPDFHPLVEFCIQTGARLTSAIRLTWKQVDYGAGVVTLRVKGGGEHSVPITPSLRVLLANQKGKHAVYVLPYQCVRSRGKRRKGEYYPFSKDGWRKVWADALAAAGIENFRFHDQRHTAGSRITRVRGIHVAQKLLGHTDISTTKRYAHVQVEDVRAAMEDAEKRHQDAEAGQENAEVSDAAEQEA